MNTPIVDFVRKNVKCGFSRFHMPGHKGRKILGAEPFDITEIDGADVLYSPEGIISDSMKNAAELFGTEATFYSTEGSTLSIKAMIATAVEGVENPKILAARNVHKAFVYAAALLGLEVEWLYNNSGSICECEISPEMLREALKNGGEHISAVYVTSPDYLGNILDIEGLSAVCREFDLPLLVDNAHGAYLKFLKSSRHPIDLGAAMCADSAHKTLPVLTGGGYLHVSKGYSKYAKTAIKKLSLFASTSPSYLILQSLDLCNKYLFKDYENRLEKCIENVEKIKELIVRKGFNLKGEEPLKITIDTLSGGYTGEQFYAVLKGNKIEVEFYDNDHLVLMVTPENSHRDFARLKRVLRKLPKLNPITQETVNLPEPKKIMDIRRSVLGKSITVPIDNSIGEVCAAPTVSCPPAIPIIVSGEVITSEAVTVMKKYKITEIDIVKDAN